MNAPSTPHPRSRATASRRPSRAASPGGRRRTCRRSESTKPTAPGSTSKLTPQPTGVYLPTIKLTGAREKVAKKTYIRAPRYPQPGFDKAYAECKADKSWQTFETSATGHDVMVDDPQWLMEILLKVS